MLPTDDSTSLIKDDVVGNLVYMKEGAKKSELKGNKNQHLYILSDDEHGWVNGVWYYSTRDKKLLQMENGRTRCGANYFIIATTDPKLQVDYKESYEVQGVMMKGSHIKHLHQIPQSLVEYYAKHQPEEVGLEYEWDGKVNYSSRPSVYELKLNNNEVVVIRYPLVSEFMTGQKLYTREEVEKLFIEYEIAHRDQGADREQWLKDNL